MPTRQMPHRSVHVPMLAILIATALHVGAGASALSAQAVPTASTVSATLTVPAADHPDVKGAERLFSAGTGWNNAGDTTYC